MNSKFFNKINLTEKLVFDFSTTLSLSPSDNEQDGLNRFSASVKDIQLFLRTYSNSGN